MIALRLPKNLDLGPSAINTNLKATPGTVPRPSSHHPSVVNVIFCDGPGRTLSEKIAPGVYARLISPDGNRFGQEILSSRD